MPTVLDAQVALRWLGRARRGFLAAQAAFLVLAGIAEHEVAVLPWLAALAGLGLLDALVPRGDGARAVQRHAVVDLLGMALLLTLSGGAQNPVSSFLLVELALLAVVLPAAQAWGATVVTLGLYALMVAVAHPLHGLDEAPHEHPLHLLGHVLAFDVAAVAITALVGRLSATLRARDDALRDALVRQSEVERLAALGTLAAGTAHALGTPLGAIELLAEEMALDLPPEAAGRAAWTTLRGEVARSRLILDDLLTGDAGTADRTVDIRVAVQDWADGWQRAHPDREVQVTVDGGLGPTAVRGAAVGWRHALWTVLDNAAHASTAPVAATIRVHRDDATVQVDVVDRGGPADPVALARAGQPFHTAWPDGRGNGLGLYVARRFARGTGGDLLLAPAPNQGVRVTLRLPVEGR